MPPSVLMNRPLPSSKNPHFQNEAMCTTFLVEKSFICMRMKNHFHIKGWALHLVLIQRPGELGNGPLTFVVVFPGKTTRGDFTKPTWRIYERHKGSYERSVLWDVCFNQLSGKTYESSLKLCSHFSYTGLPFVSTRKAGTHRTSYRGSWQRGFG